MPPETTKLAVSPESATPGRPRGGSRRPAYGCAVLRDIPWKLYEKLRDVEANNHVRMTYLDGTLLIMSPEYLHDFVADRLGLIVRIVAASRDVDVAGTLTTTLKKKGDGGKKGTGKEPDNGFYVGPNERRIRGKWTLDLDVDPPPDLAIEVVNKADSKVAETIYARLGIPEVWRHRARKGTLQFGRLSEGRYEPIGRSLCLPWLTPVLVLEALSIIEDGQMSETTWLGWLLDWARQLPEPPPAV